MLNRNLCNKFEHQFVKCCCFKMHYKIQSKIHDSTYYKLYMLLYLDIGTIVFRELQKIQFNAWNIK